MKKLLLLVFLASIFTGYSQNERRIFFGVNAGTKLANKYYATRYAGWYNNQLVQAMELNAFNYNQIYQLLGQYNYYLPYDYAPLNMRYQPGLMVGVTGGFQLSPNIQMSLDANIYNLSSQDVFTVVVEDPTITLTEPLINTGQLYAKETRFNGKYNIDYVSDGDKFKYIIGIHGLMTAWRIDQHWASFPMGQYTMQLFSRHDPLNNVSNKVTSLGWGAGINLGVEYRLSDMFVLQLMYQPHHAKFNVGYDIVNNNGNLKRFFPQHDISVRILWK